MSVADAKTKATLAKERPRTKPPTTPKSNTGPIRLKSIDRLQGKATASVKLVRPKQQAPNNLDLTNSAKKDSKRSRASSSTRTPIVTPTDDGRWPSVNSKPAPLMSRSMRGALDTPRPKITQTETKTIEKYATLPRRKKEKSDEKVPEKEQKKTTSRDSSISRMSMAKKQSSKDSTPSKMTNYRIKQKTKIYHEFSIQTALTMSDIEKALNGVCVQVKDPNEQEKCDIEVQVDIHAKDIEKLQEELRSLKEKYNTLSDNYNVQTVKLKETEDKLKVETLEKQSLKEELHKNSQRVLAILGQETADEGNFYLSLNYKCEV